MLSEAGLLSEAVNKSLIFFPIGNVILIGGNQGIASVEDIEANIDDGETIMIPDLPMTMTRGIGGSFYDSNSILVCGGLSQQAEYLNECFKLNMDNRTWNQAGI